MKHTHTRDLTPKYCCAFDTLTHTQASHDDDDTIRNEFDVVLSRHSLVNLTHVLV